MGCVLESAVTQLHAWSADRLATEMLPGDSALIRIADDESLLSGVLDEEHVIDRLCCFFNDVEEDYLGIRAPTKEDAERIFNFAHEHCFENSTPHLVVQCQAGVGRSLAVCAALDRIWNNTNRRPPPTANRTLYRHLLELGEGFAPAEPLVSLAVRVKYGPDRLGAFLLSMLRQRYDNWEVVAFTDGPNYEAQEVVEQFNDERVTLLETTRRLGRWGHPYRQAAFERCQGEWIGTQNDDNYLTPGYLEQMVAAAEDEQADVVCCQMLHRYSGWGVVAPGGDLCGWLAKAKLIHKTKWEGTGFIADRDYLLKISAGNKVATVGRPLVVKN